MPRVELENSKVSFVRLVFASAIFREYKNTRRAQAKLYKYRFCCIVFSYMNPQVVTFRPTGKNTNRVLLAKTLGINMSEVMNELMEKYGDAELKKRTAQLQKSLERAKGLEPSTFTLAT